MQITGGPRPVELAALERLAQHAAVEAGVVGHEHAALEQAGQLREHLVRRGRGVDHGLRDAGEPLDAARQRAFRPHQRVECVVQLTAAHEHGAHLGQLAEVAGEPVGLGVDGEKLGARERLVE